MLDSGLVVHLLDAYIHRVIFAYLVTNKRMVTAASMLIVDYDLKILMMWYLWCEFSGQH